MKVIFFPIEIKLPNSAERIDILNIHLKKRAINISKEALEDAAKASKDFTGSELENIVNEASFLAFRRGKVNLAEGVIKDEDLKSIVISLI